MQEAKNIMIRRCQECNEPLQYLDNTKNNYTFLICPKCHERITDEWFVTVDERIQQGYERYERAEEKIAKDWHERYIVNNEDEKD